MGRLLMVMLAALCALDAAGTDSCQSVIHLAS